MKEIFNIYSDFFIIYLKEDYIDKYFTKSIIVITFFSALYIFYSYNPNYLKYDIRTYTFGTYSTNWSIGLAFIILYSVKKNIPFAFIAIIYYAQLISGGRAGILTTIVGFLILFSIKKEYSKLLLILILTVSYDFIKPTHYLNGNSNRQYVFLHYKSQLVHILSDVNPINNFPGLIFQRPPNFAQTKLAKTKPEKTELVRFSRPLYASSARAVTNTPRGSTTYDERKKLLREISRLKKQSTRFKTLVEETEQKIFAIEEKFGVEDFYRHTTPEEVRKLQIKKHELSDELSGHLIVKNKIEKQKADLIASWEKIGIDKPEPSKEDIQKELFDDLQQIGKTVDNRKVRIDHLELRKGIYVLIKNPMVVVGKSHRTITNQGYLMLVVKEGSDTEIDDAEAKVIRNYGGVAKWRGEDVRVDSSINISNVDVIAVSEDNKRFYIVYPKTLASLMYFPLELRFNKIEGYQHNLDGWILDIPYFI